jgi:catechol 2,3-dioxygenase-like lactoylglutathione lyase family enzyme
LAQEEVAMIDHTGIGVADVGRSAAFYDAVLGALDLRRVMQLPESEGTDGIGYGVDYPIFWIDRFHPHSVSQHVAFAARSRVEVESFHAAALRAGDTDTSRDYVYTDWESVKHFAEEFLELVPSRFSR